MAKCPFLFIGPGRKKKPDQLPPESANSDIWLPSGRFVPGDVITINVIVRNEEMLQSAWSNVTLFWSQPLTDGELYEIETKSRLFPTRQGGQSDTWVPFDWTIPEDAFVDGALSANFVAHVDETGSIDDPDDPFHSCPVNSAYDPWDASDYRHPCRAVHAVHIVR